MPTGSVSALYRYPVKSCQGLSVEGLTIDGAGVVGDRRWALFDEESGKVATAKRFAALLGAAGADDHLTLPDGRSVALDAPDAAQVLSAWLGRRVALIAAGERVAEYEMTFDPPDDTATLYAIPTPPGSLTDLAAVHVINRATLEHCARSRPDLDWDLRRFRPNVVVDVDGPPFAEDAWVGAHLAIGDVVLQVTQATVRCAMPLRAQPAGVAGSPALERQPSLFAALTELHTAMPNHLGVYLEVAEPGTVRAGDRAEVRA